MFDFEQKMSITFENLRIPPDKNEGRQKDPPYLKIKFKPEWKSEGEMY